MIASTKSTIDRPCIPAPLSIAEVPVVPFETYDQALDCIATAVELKHKSFWVAINPIKIYRAWRIPQLHDLLCQADVGFCDGIGISVAARILHGQSIKQITGCDLFFRILAVAAQKNWSVYLLGASPESNAAARTQLQKMHPALKIAGSQDGYFDDSRKVIEQMNASNPDLLFVAMGSPKQEEWIAKHRDAIDASFCMGVGGSFDIAAGKIKRAPKLFRMTGTEFLFRFALEPRKRFSHQAILVSFMLQIIRMKLTGVKPLTDEV